jgi:ribosomal protein S18 acetylase RimI-like enzyme
MNMILQDLTDASLAEAIEANLYEFLGTARQWPRAKVYSSPELEWFITGDRFSLFNSLYRTRLTAKTVETAIQAANARGWQRGISMLWWTGPASTPADLGARLEQYGFQKDIESGMAADLQAWQDKPPDPTGLTIELVQDPETLKTWCQTLVTGFDFPVDAVSGFLEWLSPISLAANPRLYNYLGRLNGEAVATSSVFYGAGVAGIYNIATRPDARRRGIGLAMTRTALRAGHAAGYRAATLQATEMGAPVYRKLGFKACCEIGIYAWEYDLRG